MSLSSKDINFILNLLNEETCGLALTFDQISNEFREKISPSNYLRVGNALVLLLQNRDLTPTPAQRLIIFYLFFDMYKTEQSSMSTNPFAPVFQSVLQVNGEIFSNPQKHFHWIISPVTSQERSFVSALLNRQDQDVLSRTPTQILQSELHFNDSPEAKLRLVEDLRERTQQLPVLVQCHLPALINDPEIKHFDFETLVGNTQYRAQQSRRTIEDLLLNNTMKQTISPEYLRLVPPLHECTIDEYAWLSPMECDPSLFTWDSSMCLAMNHNHEVRVLMDKAYQGGLNLRQQQRLLDALDQDSNLVHHIGLQPSKLPSLVENSPSISIHCLLNLVSSKEMPDYLSSLVNMNMSLHSIEVVNRLSTSIALPREFLHHYISTCLRTCEETKDKYLQNRFVRLVSVFIQSLARNKAIDVKDLFLNVQSFCIHFRHIKEAAALFQLYQTFGFDIDSAASSSSNTTSSTVDDD